jgi:hypothetical protein
MFSAAGVQFCTASQSRFRPLHLGVLTAAAENKQYFPSSTFSALPYMLLLSKGLINIKGRTLKLCSLILFHYRYDSVLISV